MTVCKEKKSSQFPINFRARIIENSTCPHNLPCASTMMIRNRSAMQRLFFKRLKDVRTVRSYHASSRLSSDALDMADSFAHRHSEFPSILGYVSSGILFSLFQFFLTRTLSSPNSLKTIK